MKYIRFAALLLACAFALGCCACTPREVPAGDEVIDIPLDGGDTPTVIIPETAAPSPTAASTLAPLILGTPAAPVQTPVPTAEATPAPTPAPTAAPTQAPAKTAVPTATPAATTAPAAAETPIPSSGEDLPYYLYVEKGSFTLTIYQKGSDGTYSEVYKTYRIAHGGNKTPAGSYTLQSDRERWHEFPDGGFVQYATRYHGRLYLHSPLYGEENNGYMWPKYYDGELGIGKESTGGCLRMVTEAARFIYENCPDGTVLEIVNGSPKGTTSSDVPSRNGKRFDPTDVDAGD